MQPPRAEPPPRRRCLRWPRPSYRRWLLYPTRYFMAWKHIMLKDKGSWRWYRFFRCPRHFRQCRSIFVGWAPLRKPPSSLSALEGTLSSNFLLHGTRILCSFKSLAFKCVSGAGFSQQSSEHAFYASIVDPSIRCHPPYIWRGHTQPKDTKPEWFSTSLQKNCFKPL